MKFIHTHSYWCRYFDRRRSPRPNDDQVYLRHKPSPDNVDEASKDETQQLHLNNPRGRSAATRVWGEHGQSNREARDIFFLFGSCLFDIVLASALSFLVAPEPEAQNKKQKSLATPATTNKKLLRVSGSRRVSRGT